jgi:hypothetical protein
MSEPVKQEGEFKLKTKKTVPRKLTKSDEPTKVDLSNVKTEEEPTKVVIPKQVEDAIQEPITTESMLRDEQPKVELQEVGQGNEGSIENVIQEISAEELAKEVEEVTVELKQHIQEQATSGKKLPENVEKLVSFMEETGGTVEDYVRLNVDYSNIDSDVLLKEYYKQTRPHLTMDEIDFLIEDNFDYDEEIDDERDVRKRKLAFKEEVAKAKNYLDGLKSKYYDEIKLRPGVTQEQQKAMDFFNRYSQDQQNAETQHSRFKTETKAFFSQDFKGFDFNLGEKNFRYGVSNPDTVAEKQSNITNLIKKFLNEDGSVKDVKGYHKAMYAAENVDALVKHFYEQGKADAIKDVVAKSNNITSTSRQAPVSDGYINGWKVKAINGVDSAKLKIKR